MRMKLVLASSSPRRSQLLNANGISFSIDPPDIDETFDPTLSPSENVVCAAIKKAGAVAGRRDALPVLAADTIVVLGEAILGKPKDKKDAVRMLNSLSGREHMVITGVSLVWHARNISWSHAEVTFVMFKEISSDLIDNYVNTGEPMDKAGGYAIQGGAKEWIANYRGSLTNIIGLPMEPLLEQLQKIGLYCGDKDAKTCR